MPADLFSPGMQGSARHRETGPTPRLPLAARIVRTIGVGTLGGIIAGLLVGGAGSRVAMRIVAITAGPDKIGAITDNGNQVGAITLAGTLELVFFVGLFSGIAGGLVYAAVQPWMAGLGRWRGFVFGLLLLATFGFAFIDPDNPDFRRFGVPILNVCLFAALFVLYGLVAAPVVNRLEHALPDLATGQPSGVRTLGAYLLVGVAVLLALLFGVMGTISLIAAALGQSEEFFLGGALLLCVLIVALVAHGLRARAAGGPDRPLALSARRGTAIATYAILAAPALAGLVLTIAAIREILLPAA